MRASLCVAMVLLAPACTAAAVGDDPMPGDEGSDGTDMPDPGGDPDPDPDPDPGAEDETCPPDAFGTVDALKDPKAYIDRTDPEDPESQAVRVLHGLAAPDSDFEIGLWEGYGVFAESPAAPGDYPIAGDEADPASCGICVELRVTLGDIDRTLVATAGSISITSVDGNLTGSGTTLTLEEVDGNNEIVSGGCTSSITRIVFDAPLDSAF